MWELSRVDLNDLLGGGVQLAGTAIVAEAFPKAQHVDFIGVG